MAVCAPSGPPDPEAFRTGVDILAARYRVIQHAVAPGDVGYLAGDDRSRRDALARALGDPDARALFCARGGYGLLRIAQALPDSPPRPVVGFSDVTVLHALLRGRGRASVHGPVVTQLGRLPEPDRDALFALLEDPSPPPPATGLAALRGGVATGPLAGGNLTVLAHLVGTPLGPDLRGAVLLLEDVAEAPYRLDRMLTHLRLAGLLAQVAGVVCGEFTGCGEAAEVERVLADRLGDLGKPVAIGLPVGHGERNRALPHGARVTLDADAGSLVFHEGAVA